MQYLSGREAVRLAVAEKARVGEAEEEALRREAERAKRAEKILIEEATNFEKSNGHHGYLA